MGFYDSVTLEQADERCGIARGTVCQTKSLYAASAEFTITDEGKLVQHLFRYEEAHGSVHSITGFPLWKRVPIGERIVDYHGDVLLYASGSADGLCELVARFTQGRLEWLRPLAEFPPEYRDLLVEQGAR